ncbi:hypothetical protein AArcCO_0832 [Halalkaliarchaeum sp. AArc-CO]|uniref:hypothetical protein n=1 Tax=Halalkaliarchaeum sp. AArc-CO TaxID=2866381 RepID=UPI00217D0B6E|nr:hypothetical protein [Halalkaliarchaeum sp. AArc-CO]UWG50150.1 hypothetical protein AArcCO_0832 [Halalkaliarchaeum sp. AArc-CO]
MTEVVLKGELHTSSGDLEEECELVKEGIDTLVLEGAESEPDYGWKESWFSTSLDIFGLIMNNLYVGKDILIDLAEIQDADVVYTRESDSELLDNTSRWMQWMGAILFYLLVSFSILFGLSTGNTVGGAFLLLIGVLLPILLIRIYNMERSSEDNNRDQIMADKIVEAAEDSNRVVAVVGDSHVEGILDHLPNDIDPEVRRTSYSRLSLHHLRELAVPAFTAFSVLFVFYSGILYLSSVFLPLFF